MKNRTYIVQLVKRPNPNNYASDYFPRKFHYQREAIQCRKELESNGGLATIEIVNAQNKHVGYV